MVGPANFPLSGIGVYQALWGANENHAFPNGLNTPKLI